MLFLCFHPPPPSLFGGWLSQAIVGLMVHESLTIHLPLQKASEPPKAPGWLFITFPPEPPLQGSWTGSILYTIYFPCLSVCLCLFLLSQIPIM
ncbi:mCG148319 [Mus musculus]|nr:mCG148319 [Mus musculus]